MFPDRLEATKKLSNIIIITLTRVTIQCIAIDSIAAFVVLSSFRIRLGNYRGGGTTI